MIEKNELVTIEESIKDFFKHMAIEADEFVLSSSLEKKAAPDGTEAEVDVVSAEVVLEEPQILIGQGGQTLFELQRILRTILNRRLKKMFYFNLDINDYKKKKIDYLKNLAKEAADQAVQSGEMKPLVPMSAYERRIIHAELSAREDVVVESHGDGPERHIVISPK